jgi:hypothetical protein
MGLTLFQLFLLILAWAIAEGMEGMKPEVVGFSAST